MLRRWLVAATALGLGGLVSLGVITLGGTSAPMQQYYTAERDLPAGAVISGAAIRLEPFNLGAGSRFAFLRGSEQRLIGRRTAHDLVAGQLLQAGDTLPDSSPTDRRLVWVPVKDTPPAAAGDRVDLLLVSGPPDRTTVTPFASGVEVRAAAQGGLVIVVGSAQAAAFVYAAATAHLAAVVAVPGSPAGEEAPVGSIEQALAAARPATSAPAKR